MFPAVCTEPDHPCKNGGYPNPIECGKCLCPSGYSGDTCEEVQPEKGKTQSYTVNGEEKVYTSGTTVL